MDNPNILQARVELNNLMQSIAKTCQAMTDQVLTRIQAFIDAVHPIYQAIQQNYRDQGAIYGDSDDGMSRWLHEIAEIERLRAKADFIAEHHQMLRDLAVRLHSNLPSD